MPVIDFTLLGLFIFAQTAYFATFLVDAYHFSRPVNWVDTSLEAKNATTEFPYIVLFYPVLRELEETMRTTFHSLSLLDYPRSRFRIVAIPNRDDKETIQALRRLQREYPFVQVMTVPPTTHPSWNCVWKAWNQNPKAYWWHKGKRAGNRALPPKKTRQLIYAFYNLPQDMGSEEDFLVNYIDADSCPPRDHFLAAAIGIRDYDVLQAQNVAGNLNESLSASWHAFDHMTWDGLKYPHLSADGKQPFWVLGKGLFFRASDLIALGGFHPWLTIEDPEVGMRFWVNGRKLGIINGSLIEEVPNSFARGITQRKRWVAGFFQSLTTPLRDMGMKPIDRFKAWLNFLPCLSLWLNAVGLPIGAWALWRWLSGDPVVPEFLMPLVAVNLSAFIISLTVIYVRTWHRTGLVLNKTGPRVYYMLRINPLFILAWWVIWLIPLAIGLRMYLRDEGLVWERTEKTDSNSRLVRAARHWGGAGRAASTALGKPATSTSAEALQRSSLNV
ncbi:glycosyltransferase family 2 protein [Nitratireductor sp. CH_MIT9313-5]|uniref:glycosyltransferase family 2 protein n=1 Tax=Nitratireductor sp. CH_MIT9313-5 TaxID=3107764 RepID=UPI003009A18F